MYTVLSNISGNHSKAFHCLLRHTTMIEGHEALVLQNIAWQIRRGMCMDSVCNKRQSHG